jgi:hypothetical protein
MNAMDTRAWAAGSETWPSGGLSCNAQTALGLMVEAYTELARATVAVDERAEWAAVS